MDIRNTSYKQKSNNNPLGFLRRWRRRLSNERFLKHWATRRDGDAEGKYYVKRYYELNFEFYDLYWYIKTTATRQRVYTHYLRISEETIRDTIEEVETTQLPLIFDSISKEEV